VAANAARHGRRESNSTEQPTDRPIAAHSEFSVSSMPNRAKSSRRREARRDASVTCTGSTGCTRIQSARIRIHACVPRWLAWCGDARSRQFAPNWPTHAACRRVVVSRC
jgi:hypothetical protein